MATLLSVLIAQLKSAFTASRNLMQENAQQTPSSTRQSDYPLPMAANAVPDAPK
jgi:hypothetical protein